MDLSNKLEIKTRQELRDWLMDNHEAVSHAWIPILSKEADELSYLAVVEEAICFGWIDSTKKRMGDVLHQRISPRRKGGNWTELNKERARRLIGVGLMMPAGEKALPDLSKESFVIAEGILKAIQSDSVVWEHFKELPDLYIRVRIDNIQSYPSDSETYERRLEKFLLQTKAGKLYGDWSDNGRLEE